MLPAALCSFTTRGDRVIPRYLTPRDDVWVRELVGLLDAYGGRSVGELEADLPERLASLAREHRVPARSVAGVAHLLRRDFKARVRAPVEPRRARRAVFAAAAAGADEDRLAVLARVALELDVSPEDLEVSLYADLHDARRLEMPAEPPAPRETVERYNLALLQGLLRGSEVLELLVREHVRAVVRTAKLRRLLCTYRADPVGTRLVLSGPLALFRHTTKYGHALAAFVPALAATPGWALSARCRIRDDLLRLDAGAGDPIARAHALPRDADSAVERALVRDFRRLGTTWSIERETAAVEVGTRVFFPDFTLRRGEVSILVELVGYYTEEYLASKLEALRAAAPLPMIVVIDDDLACDDGVIAASAVVRYRRRVDARALVEAAERVASARCGGP